MTNQWVMIVGLGLIGWLVVLSWFYFRQRQFISRLFVDPDDPNMKQQLMKLLEEIEDANERQQFLAKQIKELALTNLKGLQKSAMIRYNPYGDVGGDQSFSMAMLNGLDSGWVLTSLHTRSGTRVYAKEVIKGRAEIELSSEESAVLKSAIESDS